MSDRAEIVRWVMMVWWRPSSVVDVDSTVLLQMPSLTRP